MSGSADEFDQLRTLERLRTLELEHAQLEHATAAAIELGHTQLVEKSESEIAAMQTFAREQLTESQALSADSLRRIHEFAVVQARELDLAKAALADSKQVAAQAFGKVVNRFEDLSVIERLRERREIEVNKETARREQRLLDEHALAHLADQLGGAGAKRE